MLKYVLLYVFDGRRKPIQKTEKNLLIKKGTQ